MCSRLFFVEASTLANNSELEARQSTTSILASFQSGIPLLNFDTRLCTGTEIRFNSMQLKVKLSA